MSKHSFNAYILSILCLVSSHYTFNEQADENIPLVDSIAHNYTISTYGPEKITPVDDTKPNGFSESLQKEFAARELILSDHEIQKIAFDLATDKREFNLNILNPDIIDRSFIDRLEIVGNGKNKSHHLVESLIQDHTHTALGNAFTALTLCHPTTDLEILRNRQQIISELGSDERLCTTLASLLAKIAHAEKKSLIFWQNKPIVNEKTLATIRFAKINKYIELNTKPAVLEAWNKELWVLFNLGTAIGLPIVQYNVTAKYAPAALPIAYAEMAIGTAISALISYYLTSVLVKNEIAVCNHIHDILISTAEHIAALKKISIDMKRHKTALNDLPSLKPLIDFADTSKHSKKLNKLIDLLGTKTFTGEPSVFNSYTGRVLAAYELMQQVKGELAPVFAAAGELDMYVGLAKLYKSREGKEARYCMVNFIEDSSAPIIDAHNFWNPFIDADTVIVNDFKLDSSCPNSILTGPNTGGKSTILKGIMDNILIAQVFGIAASTRFTITPFAKLDCFMNIADEISQGLSRFESEVMRAKKVLEIIQSSHKNAFSFIIIDEIFTSTTPTEGEMASTSFAKRLGTYKNSAVIIATHYPKMIDLETEMPGTFYNHHVEILRNEDGSLHRTFKLKNGPSHDNVAFDILKERGLFD